jgi:hypothetical protein
MAVASRLRRTDERTGWLLAVGGSFLTIAIAFSGGVAVRVVAPLAIAAGVVSELVVLHDNPGQLTWLGPVLVVVGTVAAAALAMQGAARLRAALAVAAALAVLLVAPAAWAVDTLGHAASGTFPAGGPATVGFGGGAPGGGGGGFPGGRGATPGGQSFGPGGAGQGVGPGSGNHGALPGGGHGAAPGGPMGGFGGGAAGRRGGGFGGDNASLTEALSYVRAHGGGTIAVSSQSGAAPRIIASGADVAGIGGFSGRESEISLGWLADAVRSGQIRWILVDGTGTGGRPGGDGRVGASRAMAAVAQTCRAVSYSTSSSGATLYDCQGSAGALAALAAQQA